MNTTEIFSVRNAVILYAAVNIITFALYGIDKRKAENGKWRISEKTLLLFSFFFGAVGRICGMRVFHHKTKKWYFHAVCILSVIMQAALLYFAFIK